MFYIEVLPTALLDKKTLSSTNICIRSQKECLKTIERSQITKDAGDAWRTAMIQPNVYWTLEAPFVTIIGLYTNLPEGGQ